MLSTKQIITALTAIATSTGSVIAQDYQPYTNGSAADLALSFNNGTDTTVEAPLSSAGLLLTYSTSSSTGTGGGWDLSAQGSTHLGVSVPLVGTVSLASSTARTETGVDSLTFGTTTTGLLDNLVNLALPMTWEASMSVPGSDIWSSTVADTVAYNFDLELSNGLLDLAAGVFPSLSLNISDSSGSLYSGSDLGAILGLADITNTSYSSSVTFNYDPNNGPLKIQWSGSHTVDTSLLNQGSDIYVISNTDLTITPIPEPSSTLLLKFGMLALLVRRRR